ncbi:MAG: ADP-ribosylglycohydrolase family protein [Planctomycetota bacterium]|jgi:ADP-ribosylglycohydrolase
MSESENQSSRFRGVLLGTAVGDAVGLPAEGMKPATINALWGQHWRHRFLVGRGMVSDDTEHTLFVAQAMLKHGDDIDRFLRSLSWKLRWWLLGLPAGVGFGTLRAILKLWLFFPPSKSGVHSAGNGPAMRSALFGVRYRDDPARMKQMVTASTLITHNDPRALVGALAISCAAADACSTPLGQKPDFDAFLDKIARLPAAEDTEWSGIIDLIKDSLTEKTSVSKFVAALGLKNGVTGYIYHTVPAVLYAWMRHYGDFRNTLTALLNCGGDTDTVGAIAGALAGAAVGEEGIPSDWVERIWDWPRGVCLLRQVADELARQNLGQDVRPVPYFWPAVCPRNILFLLVVLGHGFLRLLPVALRRRIRL